MNVQHMITIARKEFLHIVRDLGTFALVTIGPVFLVITFTYTLTAEVRDASVAVVDHADNEVSHELIRRMDENKVVHVTEYLTNPSEVDDLMETSQIVAAIIIPQDYGLISPTGETSPVEAIIDGTEPVSAEKVLDEVYRIAGEHTRELAQGSPALQFFEEPITVEEETLFNPDLRNVVDFYPGLAAMMLGLPAIALAMSLARESEIGTLEQLVASPIDKRALLVGKMLPYLAFGMVDVYVLLVIGRVMYDVPFAGSLLTYTLFAFLFMVANLGVGLLIAVLVRSQQVAIILALLVFFVPPFFLSGLFFPVDAMPFLVQLETIELPSTHFVTASRAIQLQGASLRSLWFPAIVLAILAVELIEVAAFVFRKKVIVTFSWKRLLRRQDVPTKAGELSMKEITR